MKKIECKGVGDNDGFFELEVDSKSDKSDLLCCPFCGSGRIEKQKASRSDLSFHSWKIWCKSCQCRTGPETSLSNAISNWNMRRESAVMAKLLREVREVLNDWCDEYGHKELEEMRDKVDSYLRT